MAYTLSFSDIARVHDIIRPHIRQTPVLHANGSDVGLESFPLTLKLEYLQHTGSFKSRGAFTNLLTRPVPPAGVAAASGGNHGVAVTGRGRSIPLLCGQYEPAADENVAVVLCGANTQR